VESGGSNSSGSSRCSRQQHRHHQQQQQQQQQQSRRRSASQRAVLLASSFMTVASASTSGYSLKESYATESFFSKFTFWSDIDPTKGIVDYLDEKDAEAAGLIKASDGNVYIGSDHTRSLEAGQGRKSIRIHSRNAYNAGLFIAKIKHAPAGCGVWPAFWLFGEDAEHPWPTWGEYDIIESVHNNTRSSTTLHTSDICRQEMIMEGQDFSGVWQEGSKKPHADLCDYDAPDQYDNQGCSQRAPEGSFGWDFNAKQGGTWAAEWDPDHGYIRTWFWPAGSEPADVSSKGVPNPSWWGRPFSYFLLDASSCPLTHFQNMRIVFNIDFCGDMGEGTWQWSGCPELSKARTGSEMTCEQWVASQPEYFSEAYWSIERLDVYQREGPLPSPLGERIELNFGRGGEFKLLEWAKEFIWILTGTLIAAGGAMGAVFVGRVERRIQSRTPHGEVGTNANVNVTEEAIAEFRAWRGLRTSSNRPRPLIEASPPSPARRAMASSDRRGNANQI